MFYKEFIEFIFLNLPDSIMFIAIAQKLEYYTVIYYLCERRVKNFDNGDYYKGEKEYFAKWEKGRSQPEWWN